MAYHMRSLLRVWLNCTVPIVRRGWTPPASTLTLGPLHGRKQRPVLGIDRFTPVFRRPNDDRFAAPNRPRRRPPRCPPPHLPRRTLLVEVWEAFALRRIG